MMNMPSLLEPRLQNRYQQLVAAHLAPAQQVAAGLRGLPGPTSSFAASQAATRFLYNEDVTLPKLAEPLLVHARQAVTRDCQRFALVVHDWSQVPFNSQGRKRKDRVSLSCKNDLGYELCAALLLSDQGEPLAPVHLSLRAEDGVHSSSASQVEPAASQLDGLKPVMDQVSGLGWDKPVVHLMDREADSVAHYRAWAEGHHRFLVRADDNPRVVHEDHTLALAKVAARLRRRKLFTLERTVNFRGAEAQQWVAETTVTLTRAARPHRRDGQPRRIVPGKPLLLRLVVAEIRNAQGQRLACWLLLTNVSEASASDIALWYYWRWRIETYFKLLKSAGFHLEQWQQETAAALAKRLLVAAMACVFVWQVERSTEPAAEELRGVLVRLSGRQMKRSRPVTAPALLAGTWVLLSMLALLDHYSLADLRTLADSAGLPRTKPRQLV